MKYTSAIEVVHAILHAYYQERNVEATLACVCEDVDWIGTENKDTAKGKEGVRKLLDADVKEYPYPFNAQFEEPIIEEVTKDVALVSLKGKQRLERTVKGEFTIRGTACCIHTPEGWLVKSVHVSAPNAEIEKNTLINELETERQKQTALLENIPGGVAMYRVKKDGRILMEYLSEGLAKMRGYDSAKDLMEAANKDVRNILSKEDLALIEKNMQDSLAGGTPINLVVHMARKNQTPIQVNLDAKVVNTATLEEDDVAVFYAVETEVSKEAILAKSEQDYYRAILNITNLAYFEVDSEQNLYYSDSFKEYAVSQYGLPAIMGDSDAQHCFHPDDLPLVKGLLHEVHMKGSSTPVIVRMLMSDGSYQWTELAAHIEFGSDHSIRRMTGILRKVNKEWEIQKESLNKALEEAKSANQSKTDFLSRVSHDMRTPLNVILSIARLVPEERPSYDTLLSYFKSIEEEGSFLLNLINDVLDMQKMESGVIELKPQKMEFDVIINPVIKQAKLLAEERHIDFTVTIHKLIENAYAIIDPLRVQQLLSNLLANAMKYTPEYGKVELIVENIGFKDSVATDKITIRDNGVGMSKEFMQHMYEPFVQENGGSTSTTRGTGLGLSIVKKIVDIMGGTITCESEPGKGTTFCITLHTTLITKDEKIVAEKVEYKENGDFSFVGRKVLLCEDHPMNAMIAKKLLRRKGFSVTHAENGLEGLNMFKESSIGYYDAILMDVRMPVMDGLEATREIRALPREDAKKVPIIAMTANAYSEDVKNCIDAGMNEHLAKPMEPKAIWDAMVKYIDFSKKVEKFKVVIVDNVAVNRVLIADAIEKRYDPIMANSAEEGMEALEKNSDVIAVITDMELPGMDGHEFIRAIRQKREYDSIAILANIQFGEKEEEILKDGADDILYKPMSASIVRNRLANVLVRKNNVVRK